MVDGDIWCRKLWIGSQKKDILTYINSNGVEDTSQKNNKNAIAGKYISCSGLSIDGSKGSFIIDDDGCVVMNNSTITMTNNNNQISIDPSTGLLFTKDGAEVVKLDITNGNATFSGTIDTSESIKIGETLVIRDSNGDDGLTISAQGGTTSDSITLSAHKGRYIDVTTKLLRVYGTLRVDNDDVVTESILDDAIDKLKSWAENKFATKNSGGTIITT